jgi:AAHS family 4-hydroxybenzoate transporter-like MFS transporter
MLTDGYDIGLVAFAAPSLAKVWHIAKPAAFAPAFSAGFVGILFGSPIFGYVGDRFGRRAAIAIAAIWYGAFTLACAFATSLEMLIVLRFFAGFGIGGVLPNAIALNAEFAPARYRATMVIVMFTGVTFGGALPGPVAAALVPQYGWPILFVIGGVLPIVAAAIAFFVLPESLKFLALRDRHSPAAARIANRLAGTTVADANTHFVVDVAEKRGSVSPLELFRYGLAFVTPILWLLFIINLMTFYFINQWIPLLFASIGLPPSTSALAVTVFQIGGTVGGLILARMLDRFGFAAIALLFAVSCPIVAVIGALAHAGTGLMIAVFFAGFALLGLQFGLNATAGVIYPTRFRSFGVGWALGIGRFGSIVGPLAGGAFIAAKLPVARIFAYMAIPLVVGTILAIVLVVVARNATYANSNVVSA